MIFQARYMLILPEITSSLEGLYKYWLNNRKEAETFLFMFYFLNTIIASDSSVILLSVMAMLNSMSSIFVDMTEPWGTDLMQFLSGIMWS